MNIISETKPSGMNVISKTKPSGVSRWQAPTARTYGFALVGAYLAMLGIMAAVNFLVDPYGVFKTDLLIANNVNERFAKIYHLDLHRSDYDTYIFGSSTVGLTSPSVFERYLPGSKVYNLYVSNGDMSDFVVMLRYMLRRQYIVKTVVLQLDPDAFLRPAAATRDDHSRRQLPQVSGEPQLKFYTDYLFSFSPKYLWEKIVANLQHRPYGIDVDHSGTWRNAAAERVAPGDWAALEPSFKFKAGSEYKGESLAPSLRC
jgi:hypothetical protein